MLRISISLATVFEISIRIGNFANSYARKQKLVFFLNTVYSRNLFISCCTAIISQVFFLYF